MNRHKSQVYIACGQYYFRGQSPIEAVLLLAWIKTLWKWIEYQGRPHCIVKGYFAHELKIGSMRGQGADHAVLFLGGKGKADQISRRINGKGGDFSAVSADAKAQSRENRSAKKKKSEGREVVFSIH